MQSRVALRRLPVDAFSQNRDGAAIQAKLDEILRSMTDARSGFVGIEKLTDIEIGQIKTSLGREVLQHAHGAPDTDAPTVETLLEQRSDLAQDVATSSAKSA
jgi:low affinity Fe/Cu permease